MRSIIKFFILLVILTSLDVSAQEFALDFTRADCKGEEHHLFSEHDSGSIIILDFVMLGCAPCIWATKDLDTIVTSYSNTHPGRVKIYSFSYENTHTCEQMYEWRTIGGFPDVTLFTQGADMVSYYGGMGMPSIVVTGSSLHKVFYNGYGYAPADDSAIIAAIDNALTYDQSGVFDRNDNDPGFRVYPTIFSNRLSVETKQGLDHSELLLYDIYGRQVYSATCSASKISIFQIPELPKGQYIARLKIANGLSRGVKVIRTG